MLQISAAGEVQEFLMDPTGETVSMVPSVVQKGSRLYMGQLAHSYITYLDLPEENVPEVDGASNEE